MSIEDGYRRLLRLYPRPHRLLYDEEMIAVLMAGAEPGRRRPSPAECLDIAVSATAVRLRHAGQALASDAWRQAAYLVLIGGSLLLLAIGLRRNGLEVAGHLRHPDYDLRLGVSDWVRPMLWALVAVTGVARLRPAAALLATAAAMAEGVRVAAWYAWSPSQVLQACWLLTIAALTAVSAAALARAERLPRPRGMWLLAAAGALTVAGGFIDYRWAPSVPLGRFSAFIHDQGVPAGWGPAFYVAAAALTVRAWLRLTGAVRRRTLVFGLPVLAMLIMVPYGFGGFMTSSQRNIDHPNPLLWFQWVILVAVPALTFAVGVLAVDRYERLRHLVRLGRAVEQREVAPER